MPHDLPCRLYHNVGIFTQVRISEARDYSCGIFIICYILNPCQVLLVCSNAQKLLRTSGLSGCPEQLFLLGSFIIRWRLTSRHHTLAFPVRIPPLRGCSLPVSIPGPPFLLTGSRGFPNRFCRVQCLGDQVQNDSRCVYLRPRCLLSRSRYRLIRWKSSSEI